MEEALLIICVLLVYGFMAYFNAKVTEKRLFAVKYIVIASLFTVIFNFEETDFPLILLLLAGVAQTLWTDLKHYLSLSGNKRS